MKDYFCGWYFKCQSDSETLALIPSFHKTKNGKFSSVQLITESEAFAFTFPYESFKKDKNIFLINIGKSSFGASGVNIYLHNPDVSVVGAVEFKNLSPIKYDIMGPFKYVPFMECRHSVYSMMHRVSGDIYINGRRYKFKDDFGYIEGDRGHSFPEEYLWTQTAFEGGSLMLSVAKIPVGVFNFTGIIGIVQLNGKEYRIATYLGARIEKLGGGEAIIRQGSIKLSAKLIKKHAHPLLAPNMGIMERTIHESAACRASYRFEIGGDTLLSFETRFASFEYEYKR